MEQALGRRGRPAGSTGCELLTVAREVFLEHGYARATMDEVAGRGHISKTSLYREHPSKEALFRAVVTDWAAAGRDAMRPHLERLVDGTDTRADLIALAQVMRDGILSRDVLRMRRLVTSESERFPEVAAEYLEQSWDSNVHGLADALTELGRQGRLRVPSAGLAADQLTWLVVGAPLNRELLAPTISPKGSLPPVESAVDLFLAGYQGDSR